MRSPEPASIVLVAGGRVVAMAIVVEAGVRMTKGIVGCTIGRHDSGDIERTVDLQRRLADDRVA
jgi:hypothetical protein